MSLSAWTHHSLLKATASVNFASGRLAKGAVNREARELLRELTRARESYLEQLSDPSNSSDAVMRACNDYLALLQGLIDPPPSAIVAGGKVSDKAPAGEDASKMAAAHIKEGDGDGAAAASGENKDEKAAKEGSEDGDGADNTKGEDDDANSKEAKTSKNAKGKGKKVKEEPMTLFGAIIPGLRGATMFKWLDALSGKQMDFMDAQVELIASLLNLALWHCLHASVREAKASTSGDADGALMKEVYNALRTASAVFSYVDKFELSKVEFRENHDFDERLVESMGIQCLAEAQEVTTVIAMKRKLSPTLISGLARDNAELFAEAKTKIDKMPQQLAADLKSYCDFKIKFYRGTRLYEQAAALYEKCEETSQCGPAVKCCNDAVKLLFESAAASEAYIKEKKRRSNKNFNQTRDNDPTKLDSFRDVAKDVKLLLDKAERERNFIYHDKIPEFTPEPLDATRLVKVDPYSLPNLDAAWDKAQFNETLIPLKGQDLSADKASSDSSRIKTGRHFAPAQVEGSLCSIQ